MSADWSLRVPPQTTEPAGKVKAGTALVTPAVNLLANDAPTKLVGWLLTTIRVPVALVAIPTVDPAALEATVTMILRRGGDIVWSQTVPVIMQKEAAKRWLSNLTMGGDLQNPIALPTGKSLTLEVSVSYSTELEGLETRIGISQERTATFGEPRNAEGFIAYSTVKNTGHREL